MYFFVVNFRAVYFKARTFYKRLQTWSWILETEYVITNINVLKLHVAR